MRASEPLIAYIDIYFRAGSKVQASGKSEKLISTVSRYECKKKLKYQKRTTRLCEGKHLSTKLGQRASKLTNGQRNMNLLIFSQTSIEC